MLRHDPYRNTSRSGTGVGVRVGVLVGNGVFVGVGVLVGAKVGVLVGSDVGSKGHFRDTHKLLYHILYLEAEESHQNHDLAHQRKNRYL